MSVTRRRSVRLGLLGLLGAVVLAAAVPALARDPDYENRMRMVARYLSQGVPDAAAQMLEQILDKYPDDARAGAAYAGVLIQMDRLDDAETFLSGILPRAKDPAELYQARVKLRRAQNRPLDAFADVLLVLGLDPERGSWAFRETQDLLEAGADGKRLRRTAEEAVKDRPDEVGFTVLEAVIVSHLERPEDGLRLMIRFDDKHGGDGGAILRFADEMELMGKEGPTLEATLAALPRVKATVRRTELMNRVADIQERQEKYTDALATLGRIATERQGTAAAANALLRSAEISQEHLDDPKGALAVYRRIQDDPVLGHHRPQMLLQMADCYVRLGDFENAEQTYRAVIPEALDPEHAELASLELGEVEFYRGNPDSALVLYQDMAEGHPRSLYTDQAADRYITLNRYHQSDPEGVVLWGKLEWARHVADSTAVDESAQALLRNRTQGELAVEALLALAESAEAGGNLEGALGYLDRLVRENPGDRKAPEALMRMGHILADGLGRPQEGLLRYESILTDYPTSVQAGDARRLVEALRSDLKS